MATLYDKNANPLFEFGKRFRNTIRVCPFSQIVMIGGFGSLDGEIDFWQLSTMKQIGSTKSECAVGVEWAPDGLFMHASILYHLVKVDNAISLFTGAGTRVLKNSVPFTQLHFAQWQPRPKAFFRKPDIRGLKKLASIQEEKKPKKMLILPGGGNDAFAQMMRQQMGGGAGNQGPRKLNAGDQK